MKYNATEALSVSVCVLIDAEQKVRHDRTDSMDE